MPGDLVDDLRFKPGFMPVYEEGVQLLVMSWGWDLARGASVRQPSAHQVCSCLAKMSDWPFQHSTRWLATSLGGMLVIYCGKIFLPWCHLPDMGRQLCSALAMVG